MAEAKQKNKNKTKFTAKKVLCLSMAVLLFSAAVSIIITGSVGNNRAAYFIRGMFIPDGTVQDGALQAEGLDPVGEIPEGEIRYYINRDVILPNGYALADVMLQNPENCAYTLQFRYYLADGSSKKPVFTSPLIRPGQYLSEDKFDYYLPGGTYECTYTVTAYAQDNLTEPYGTSSGLLTVFVGG